MIFYCLCSCNKPAISPNFIGTMSSSSAIGFGAVVPRCSRVCVIKASAVDSSESSSDFSKRIERAWLISQQPRPVVCDSCNSNGSVECKWCAGTGFFILGDNMLCQVPSKNSTCVICAGKGSMQCSDCKGTGFRAKWLQMPPISK